MSTVGEIAAPAEGGHIIETITSSYWWNPTTLQKNTLGCSGRWRSTETHRHNQSIRPQQKRLVHLWHLSTHGPYFLPLNFQSPRTLRTHRPVLQGPWSMPGLTCSESATACAPARTASWHCPSVSSRPRAHAL